MLAKVALIMAALVVTDAVEKEGKAEGQLEFKYAKARSAARKGMLILEGMKMESQKTENMLQKAEDLGGRALTHAQKMDTIMKMALRSFEQKHERFLAGVGTLRSQLESLQNHKEAE